MNTEPTPASDAPATLDPEQTVALAPDVQRVRIGRFDVPKAWVLSLCRASCSLCNGKGEITVHGAQGPRTAEICPRATLRAQNHIARFYRQQARGMEVPTEALQPTEPAGPTPALLALRNRLAKLEKDLAERDQRFGADSAMDSESAAILERRSRAAVEDFNAHTALIEQLDAEMERLRFRMAEHRRLRDEAFLELQSAGIAARKTRERVEQAKAEHTRNTAGRRAEVEKLRRRLALKEARHA